MSKKIALFLFFLSSLAAVQKVSILIPCHYTHFPLLEELLTAYAHQTLIPNEVVISLSQCDEVSPLAITALEQQPWPFKVILLQQKNKYPAAMNRKFAAQASTGDLLMFQDADDLPHPQRVEIVKYLFEHNRINHLIHSFVSEGDGFTPYSAESFRLIPTTFDLLISGIPEGASLIPLHHGHLCVSRHVVMNAYWKPDYEPGEDLHFNIGAMRRFPRTCYVTPLRLVLFRSSLSYFSNTPPELRE